MRPRGPALLLLLALCGCTEALPRAEPTNPARVSDGIRVTWSDGRSVEVVDAEATCRTAAGAMEVVTLTAPAMWATTAPREADPRRLLQVSVTPGVIGPRRLPLPRRHPRVGPSDVSLVLRDPATGKAYDGFGAGARGVVRVVEASCHPEPALSVVVDVALPDGTRTRRIEVEGGLASSGGPLVLSSRSGP